MKNPDEPSPESLADMPELDDQRFRRRPGRGHHARLTSAAREIDPASVRAYVGRDWAGLREGKRNYWRERLDRGGLAEALRVTDQLYEWMRARHPSWPTSQDRDEDFETHKRVAEALARTAPRPVRKRTPRVR